MEKIITKDKGDIGVACIIADLTKNGIKVALPISEHLPFDLIAIDGDGKLSRVSVKYLSKDRVGTLQIPLRTISSNSQGYKIKHVDRSVVDAFAIYCPDTAKCYYLHQSSLGDTKNAFSLRIDQPTLQVRSNQINWAKDYELCSVLFK